MDHFVGHDMLLQAAVDAAFARVETCHDAMSAHESTSDLALLLRNVGSAVQVRPCTFAVLTLAAELHRLSHGLFNVACGAELEARGRLPVWPGAVKNYATDAAAIELQPDDHIKLHAPLRLDLGGIAKGYAVDLAVESLMAQGATTGCVNAGGDLRVFGTATQAVALRHPAHPQTLLQAGTLKNGSAATSGAYFASPAARLPDDLSAEIGDICDIGDIGDIVNPRTQTRIVQSGSHTVFTASCAVADGLTKVAALDVFEAQHWPRLAAHFNASSLHISEHGISTYRSAAGI